jgi:hypothetical protein
MPAETQQQQQQQQQQQEVTSKVTPSLHGSTFCNCVPWKSLGATHAV